MSAVLRFLESDLQARVEGHAESIKHLDVIGGVGIPVGSLDHVVLVEQVQHVDVELEREFLELVAGVQVEQGESIVLAGILTIIGIGTRSRIEIGVEAVNVFEYRTDIQTVDRTIREVLDAG